MSSIDPPLASSAGGEVVMVSGERFDRMAKVWVDKVAAERVRWISAKQLEVQLPARPLGDARLSVRNPDGKEGQGGLAYYAGTVGFGRRVDVQLGANPFALRADQLDGDALPDLVGAYEDARGSHVRVALAMAGEPGRFRAPQEFAINAVVTGLAVADLNGDGHKDLAISASDDKLRLYYNDGQGAFTAQPVLLTTGRNPSDVAVDTSAAGRPALVTADYVGATLTVFSADAAGYKAKTVSLDCRPYRLVVRDFNKDGRADVAVTIPAGGEVGLLLRKESGDFAPMVRYKVGAGPVGVAAADLDLDGGLDLAVANRDDSSVSVLRGAADGTFTLLSTYKVPGEAQDLAVADVDRDRLPDLAMASLRTNQVSLLRSQGKGRFGAAMAIPVRDNPLSVVSADMDNNSLPDLVVGTVGDFAGVLLNTSR